LGSYERRIEMDVLITGVTIVCCVIVLSIPLAVWVAVLYALILNVRQKPQQL
jgi:hypothetical protein